jgi:endonuclease/exonuclease/phosphatase family metal-dependent hydrolase
VTRAQPFALILLSGSVALGGCGDDLSINPVPLPDASQERMDDAASPEDAGEASDTAPHADAADAADAKLDHAVGDASQEKVDAHDASEEVDGAEAGDGAGPEAAADAAEAGVKDADSGVEDAEDGGAADAGADQEPQDGGVSYTIRIVAANLTSGNGQSWDPGEGLRILQGLKPDVALIQEFNYGANTPADWQTMAETALGPGASVYREPAGQIPNGVVSRYPIVQSGEWEDPYVDNRDFAWVRIDLPGARDLWAISVHLLSSSGTSRTQEAQTILGHMSDEIPDGDLVVLGGDFNTDARTEGCVTALQAGFVTVAPWPVDQAANSNTNKPRSKPYDWVLANPALQAFAIPVVIGANSFVDGLVFDSRIYTPLSDVPPVLQGDSNASNMQHMAVVRDFSVP